MQVEKLGKIPRGGGGGGGGLWQAPHGMENPGDGDPKGMNNCFLELHKHLSYFWFLSTKIKKNCIIFSNFHELDLCLISMCLAFFAKFCWINERSSTFYCWRFKIISRLNMKTHTCLFFLHPYLHVLLTPPPFFLVLLIIPRFQMDSLNLQLMVYL